MKMVALLTKIKHTKLCFVNGEAVCVKGQIEN